jgi:hypothetical protein
MRFLCRGLSLVLPPDLLPEGKYPFLLNVRSYVEGTLHVRPGTVSVATTPGETEVHTIARLNDATPFNGGIPNRRVAGAGDQLFVGPTTAGATLTAVDSGYSGEPLTVLAAQPIGTPQPWLYVADRLRQRKLNVLGLLYETGIAPPRDPPTVRLAAPRLRVIESFEGPITWIPMGVVAGPLSVINRVNTTATAVVYDAGTTGHAGVALASTVNVGIGMLLTIGTEETLVQDVKLAVADTTIDGILYDDGVGPGLCTIQAAGNLLAHVRTVDWQYIHARYVTQPSGAPPLGSSIDPEAVATVTARQAFVVDGLVRIDTEYVRILSIASGKDGLLSFRCATTTVHSVGEALVGVPTCRVWLEDAHSAGETVVSKAIQHVLTPTSTMIDKQVDITAGAQSAVATYDLSEIGDRMTQPDDELHVSVNIDRLDGVKEIRVLFDCDATVTDFTRNIYFAAFEANDLIAAIRDFTGTATVPVVDAGRSTAVPREGPRQMGPETTTQLSLGNHQWIELRWRVKDMIRIGTDPTRSLRHVKAMQVLVNATSKYGAITVAYDSAWIGGGFGADVGDLGTPYIYAARYRSKATGATSRPGPMSRGGVLPRRQRIELTCPVSPDPQVDTIDYFRIGATLTKGAYLGSTPNTTAPFLDDFPDQALDKTLLPDYTDFQPWPLGDVPRVATVQVVGTAVRRLSGDAFNPAWAPGSVVLVNGITTQLYKQPASADFLEVVDSMRPVASTTVELPSPTVMGTWLPTLWGPFEGYYFAVGDPVNPGELQWTVAHNPDLTRETHSLSVTSPSTPLLNGFVWDNAAFVWSSEDLYRILPDFGRPNLFTTNVLPCGRGLWTRWAWCLTPQGPVFLAKDGIYLTNAGAPAVSLTDKDLYALFPHQGQPGRTVNGVPPPDMTHRTGLRLGYADGYVYFDYQAAGTGNDRTLVYDLKADRWFLDRYPDAALVHVGEPGTGVHDVLIGHTDGVIAHYAHGTGDDGAAIAYHIQTPRPDGGDPRKEKLVGDLALGVDAAGGNGVTVIAGFDDFTRTAPAQVVGAGAIGRETFVLDLDNGEGEMAKNVGLDLQGADVVVPSFYWWSASIIPKGDLTGKRATDWDDAGYFGAKFMQGVLVEADTNGDPRTVRVEYDGGQVGATMTVNGGDQQLQTAHSFSTPFIAHLLRLVPEGDADWIYYRHRWVWEPSPELAAYWITQPTTHDFPGYGHVERVLIAHMSLVDFDLIVTADGKPESYRIASSANAFVKTEILQRPNKGKVYQYALRSVDGSERMRIFLKDIEVRAKPWGHPEPYQILRPFGDLSREFGGARI